MFKWEQCYEGGEGENGRQGRRGQATDGGAETEERMPTNSHEKSRRDKSKKKKKGKHAGNEGGQERRERGRIRERDGRETICEGMRKLKNVEKEEGKIYGASGEELE